MIGNGVGDYTLWGLLLCQSCSLSCFSYLVCFGSFLTYGATEAKGPEQPSLTFGILSKVMVICSMGCVNKMCETLVSARQWGCDLRCKAQSRQYFLKATVSETQTLNKDEPLYNYMCPVLWRRHPQSSEGIYKGDPICSEPLEPISDQQ